MTSPAANHSRPLVPGISVPWWAWALATVGLLLTYAVLQENGLVLGHGAELLHQLFHDGRHALGVPCH